MLSHILTNRARMLGSFSNADEILKGKKSKGEESVDTGEGAHAAKPDVEEEKKEGDKDKSKATSSEKKETKPVEKGKSIGKTGSGKEVFSNLKADAKEYKDFSSKDHREAADLHHKESGKGDKFSGYSKSARNSHHDASIQKGDKEKKDAVKQQPAAGDILTSKDGVRGEVKHRDDTHTYIEHSPEEGKIKVSKVKNDDVDGHIKAGNWTHHKPTNVKKDKEEIKKSENPLDIIKSHQAQINSQIYGSYIEKSKGEGSKGGKVVGHTKSGKPIYDPNHQDHQGMEKFLSKFPDDAKTWDHATDEIRDLARSAKEHHNEMDLEVGQDDKSAQKPLEFRKFQKPSEWNTEGKKYIRDTVGKMSDNTKFHFMKRHSDWFDPKEDVKKSEENDLEKGGEGSKGGKVIGHTKSGKPVYEGHKASHKDYKGFSADDHHEAATLHEKQAKKYTEKIGRGLELRGDMYYSHKDKADQHVSAMVKAMKGDKEHEGQTKEAKGKKLSDNDLNNAIMSGIEDIDWDQFSSFKDFKKTTLETINANLGEGITHKDLHPDQQKEIMDAIKEEWDIKHSSDDDDDDF